ncbi:hypothetical protein Tco_0828512 [Tanacetum coccineum]
MVFVGEEEGGKESSAQRTCGGERTKMSGIPGLDWWSPSGSGGEELDMKSMQDQVRAGVIPYKTRSRYLDEKSFPSTNRQNMSGKGQKLPGGGFNFPLGAVLRHFQIQIPPFLNNPYNNDMRSVDELARDRELGVEDNGRGG